MEAIPLKASPDPSVRSAVSNHLPFDVTLTTTIMTMVMFFAVRLSKSAPLGIQRLLRALLVIASLSLLGRVLAYVPGIEEQHQQTLSHYFQFYQKTLDCLTKPMIRGYTIFMTCFSFILTYTRLFWSQLSYVSNVTVAHLKWLFYATILILLRVPSEIYSTLLFAVRKIRRFLSSDLFFTVLKLFGLVIMMTFVSVAAMAVTMDFIDDRRAGPRRASQATIDALVQLKVDKEMLTANGEPDECPICKAELELDEVIVHLACTHWYHKHCIALWLQRHASCPLCFRLVEAVEGKGKGKA